MWELVYLSRNCVNYGVNCEVSSINQSVISMGWCCQGGGEKEKKVNENLWIRKLLSLFSTFLLYLKHTIGFQELRTHLSKVNENLDS